jgi:hypothetical protein
MRFNRGWFGIGLLGCAVLAAWAQEHKFGYQDTPLIPGTKWHVHDGLRPQPKVIEPGTAGSPPSDAVVLFDGTDLSKWVRWKRNTPATWKVENGYMEVARGTISTIEKVGDCQLHIEWMSPNPPDGVDQNRGNSGIFFSDGNYEVQILDNYQNKTYPDGQAGAIYGQYPPLVNASRKPGEWQTYDIVFTAPRFGPGAKLVKPGYLTVFHNGVCVQNHAEIMGKTDHRVAPRYVVHPPKGSIVLQDHGTPVRYRNIWFRELNGYDVK